MRHQLLSKKDVGTKIYYGEGSPEENIEKLGDKIGGTYIDKASGNWYQLLNGGWEKMVDVSGTKTLTGSGKPVDGRDLAKDGDRYLDEQTGIVYIMRKSDSGESSWDVDTH